MPEALGDEVSQYYDHNIARFLRFGGSGNSAAIHRKLWAPGVQNASQAFLYINRLAAEAIRPAVNPGPGHVLDVGCGAGGTSTWLAERLPGHVTGIANSKKQIQIAQDRADRLGLAGRCKFILADFQDLPEMEPAHAAVAIESFVHARDGGGFFQQIAKCLLPGGRLVVCDDFLEPKTFPPRQARQARGWIGRFRQGWHATSVMPVEEAVRLAEDAGFCLAAKRDLTAYVHKSSFALVIGMLLASALPLKTPFLENWRGGSALQICIRNRWIGYYALTWVKKNSMDLS